MGEIKRLNKHITSVSVIRHGFEKQYIVLINMTIQSISSFSTVIVVTNIIKKKIKREREREM